MGVPFELHYGELADTWTIQPLCDLDADMPEAGDRAAGSGEMDSHRAYRNNHEDKEVREGR